MQSLSGCLMDGSIPPRSLITPRTKVVELLQAHNVGVCGADFTQNQRQPVLPLQAADWHLCVGDGRAARACTRGRVMTCPVEASKGQGLCWWHVPAAASTHWGGAGAFHGAP